MAADDNNVSDLGSQNGTSMMSTTQIQQQRQHQQTSCPVVPNLNSCPSRSSIINYSIGSPQSNTPALGTGRTADSQLASTTILRGLSAAGSPALSACSVDGNNGVGMQVPNSALTFDPARQLPVYVPYVSALQNSHIMPKSTDLGGRWTSILNHFAVGQIGLPVSNANQEKLHGESNGNNYFQKKSFLSWRKSICLHHCYICIFFVVLFFIFMFGFPSSTTF